MKISAPLRQLLVVCSAVAILAGCSTTRAPEAKSVATPAAPEAAVTTAPASPAATVPVAPAPVVEKKPATPLQTISEEAVTDTTSAAGRTANRTRTQAEEKIVELTRVYFDFDQYVLSPEARETLNANAGVLKAAPAIQLKIEGHCDERGSDQYNIALGERRAQAAKSYLVSLGVEPERITTVSFGEEMPAEPGHDEEAWAKNRRAEFKPMP